MSVASLLSDIYENVFKFNNCNILVLFDDSNTIWLSYNDLLKSIGYNDFETQKKRLYIKENYFNTHENIYKLSKLNKSNIKNVQLHTKMINESGLYLLLSKSNKKLAKALLETIFVDILPSLRKKGHIVYQQMKRQV
jgi:prophage antirepressor-like protein